MLAGKRVELDDDFLVSGTLLPQGGPDERALQSAEHSG